MSSRVSTYWEVSCLFTFWKKSFVNNLEKNNSFLSSCTIVHTYFEKWPQFVFIFGKKSDVYLQFGAKHGLHALKSVHHKRCQRDWLSLFRNIQENASIIEIIEVIRALTTNNAKGRVVTDTLKSHLMIIKYALYSILSENGLKYIRTPKVSGIWY